MALFDAVIVGSGPAGTFSAYSLQGKNVLLMDVGYRPSATSGLEGNLYSLRSQCEDMFDELIGADFAGLHNLHRRKISLKLKSPDMSYIVRDWDKLMPVQGNFEATASFALGGLANAWGAGVFRFTARDLESFPISAAELEPFYDEAGAHMGISGANDDLGAHFGIEPGLMQPLRPSQRAAEILKGYQEHKAHFARRGITIGRSRLAVLTVPHNGRTPYQYDNLDFYHACNPAVYNPVFTLDELVRRNKVTLATGYLVMRYEEREDSVEVTAWNLRTGEQEKVRGKNLILAAGTLGSTKIVLESQGDYISRLPVLDNPMTCIPLIRPAAIGSLIDVHEGAVGELNMIYEEPTRELLQATIYGTTGPLRSDVLFELPFSIRANLAWARYIFPATVLVMLFYPGRHKGEDTIHLTPKGVLEIQSSKWKGCPRAETRIIRAFRKIGFYGSLQICQYPPMGTSLHYAGTLPMRAEPGPYQTDSRGRLYGARRVYVSDGACFSKLPAKNLTFTIMANAMRIAMELKKGLA
jgi:choline dehydrogenase-like flavoprotein